MQIVRHLHDLRAARAALAEGGRASLALVPTMGALHEGHLSLVRAARAAGHVVAASIFVNPTQFGPNEDFTRYPRDPARDCALLADAGCALAWLPEVATMYPPGDATMIDVAGLSTVLEGAVRPGHYRGVATVVAKLLGQVGPNAAWFGEKDWQQVQVIRRVASDLFLPVEIVVGPTLREADGLAMSSRNRYLDAAERARAPLLHRVLLRTRDELRAGAPVGATLAASRQTLAAGGFVLDYLELVDETSLAPLAALDSGARLLAAARLGTTRLLDTIGV
ncbi:pantoate--beta-alanine ligase [Acidocella sp. C78]|uniref:pantoate--beta-alanine ligase n=1 Tax=Acidocella sp. C78 TaxID=1671486 RepID=UPI00191BC71A|nr:pantoate--beta-alanine ligase [Acidocella sp. C78]